MKFIIVVLFALTSVTSFAATRMGLENSSVTNVRPDLDLDSYTGDYYAGPGLCDTHIEVSGNLLVDSPNGYANRMEDSYKCAKSGGTDLFNCNLKEKTCTTYNASAGMCKSSEYIILTDGNLLFLNKCTGKNFKLYKY